MNPITWLRENLPPKMTPDIKDVIEFVFLWQEYNYIYNKNSPSLGDRAGAISLSSCPSAQLAYNRFKRDFISIFKDIPSNIPDNNNPRTKLCADHENEREVKYHENGKDSLEDFMKVVYQIRCNFLHGGKMRENIENDVQLIVWAKKSLEKLLNEIHYFEQLDQD